MIQDSECGGVGSRSFRCGKATVVVTICENENWTYDIKITAEGSEPYNTKIRAGGDLSEDSVERMLQVAQSGCSFCVYDGMDEEMGFDSKLMIVPEDTSTEDD